MGDVDQAPAERASRYAASKDLTHDAWWCGNVAVSSRLKCIKCGGRCHIEPGGVRPLRTMRSGGAESKWRRFIWLLLGLYIYAFRIRLIYDKPVINCCGGKALTGGVSGPTGVPQEVLAALMF